MAGGAYVPGDGGSAHAGIDPGAANGQSTPHATATAGAPAGYSVTGIDVASWQGNVDWSQVAAGGASFAYAKATEGTSYINPYFSGQYNGAKGAGLYAGAYVFARPDSPDPAAQADFFIDHAQFAYDGKTLPPMLDLEWPYKNSSGNYVASYPCWGLDSASMVKWVRDFVTRVWQRTGKQMLIYTNTNWWNPCTGNSTAFGDQLLDVAHYDTTSVGTLPTGWPKWTIWQYASSGPLPGDQNVFNGSIADLAALAAHTAPVFTGSGDFNGDGRSGTALFFDEGRGYVSLWTMSANASGGLDPAVVRWYGPYWGSNTKYMITGDFNGDGKTDVGLWYSYGGNHMALWTMTADANGDGGFSEPVLRWDGPTWGPNTRFLTTGDFNGDGKTDVALWFSYGGNHMALWTMTADANGDGGFSGPVLRWNGPTWGPNTQFLTTGDFNGDGKTDVGLWYSYGGSHVGLWTLTAGDGGWFGQPTLRWNAPYWGPGTKFVTTGKFNSDGMADVGLYFYYGGTHVAVWTLGADANGDGGFSEPVLVWDGPTWGPNTRSLLAGRFTGAARDDLGLVYDYNLGIEAVFTLSPDGSSTGYQAPAMKWYSGN